MDGEGVSNPNESAPSELAAPPGWQKKLVPKKSGTPKNEVVFVAPNGEEFKTKRLLERFLKANPGGPSITDFEWSTGETTPTRRSARITEKVKESPVKTPESESKKKPKRSRKSQGDSEDASNKKAAEEGGEEVAPKDSVICEPGEKQENEEQKDSEVNPDLVTKEEKVDEPKIEEITEVTAKPDEKPVVETQIHPDEGALKKHSVVENEEKPKNLENASENGIDGEIPVESYDQGKLSEPVKEVHEPSQKIHADEEFQKTRDVDSSNSHFEANQLPVSTT